MTDRRAQIQAAFRLNLEQQKNRAKDLLREMKRQDPVALERMSAAPEKEQAAHPKLADAQFVIARELGFPSWAKLKSHIVRMESERSAIQQTPAPDGDSKTLHIRCGSDIRSTLLEAGFGGDFLEHSNPYTQGPVTHSPDFLEQRARFITEAYGKHLGLSFETELAAGREGERRLTASAADYERIVLWMEHDSYDQLALIRCLAHYANAQRPRALELVDVDRFPGSARFIGLGQLPAEALRILWTQRQPVTSAQLQTSVDAWDALRSAEPHKLLALVKDGTPALPNLARALYRHLRELPSIENGLSLTEQLMLQILAEGARNFSRMFHLLMNEREPLPWLGDLMLLHIIECMEQAAEPVLLRDPGDAGEQWGLHQLSITELGRAVLRGERDWLALKPPVRWVGGVKIDPRTANWRWNESKREVRRA